MVVTLSRVAPAIPLRQAGRLTDDEEAVLGLFWRICLRAFGAAPARAVTPPMREAARELLAHYGSAESARRALLQNSPAVQAAFRPYVERCRRRGRIRRAV